MQDPKLMEDIVPIPDDIKKRVIKLYPDKQLQDEAMEIMRYFHEDIELNVGSSQFCRAILTLAESNINELWQLAGIPDDPRDIIMSAEAKLGNPQHYFRYPFHDESNVE